MGPPPGHDWLVVVRREHRHLTSVSDLAEYDPEPYDSTPGGVCPRHRAQNPAKDSARGILNSSSAKDDLERGWDWPKVWVKREVQVDRYQGHEPPSH